MLLKLGRSIFLSFVFFICGNNCIATANPITSLLTDSVLPTIAFKVLDADPPVTCDSFVAIIPFTRAGNLILIKGRADTTEGNFILDTGAPGLILNMTYFRDYASTASAAGESGGITGTTSVSDPTIIRQFSFGPIKYARLDADRINLGHIENSKGVRILGLIGLQLLTRFEMIIDYETGNIYFHLIEKKEARSYESKQLLDTSLYNIFPITIVDNKLLTTANMDGKKLRFLIDTGAESTILDSRLPDRVFENVTVTGRVAITGTGSRRTEALQGNLRNLKLGNLSINQLPVIVTNLEKMCKAYDRCLDGMLGFDFLSLHKIGFNFVKKKMYIWK